MSAINADAMISRSCVVGDKAINPDAIDNGVNALFAF